MPDLTIAAGPPDIGRRPLYVRVILLLLLGAGFALAFNALLVAGSVVDDARVSRFDAARRVVDGAPATEASRVRLPSQCRRSGECTRRFRIAINGVASGGNAVYVPQYTDNLRIELNGTTIGDNTWHQSSLHLGQGVPLLVRIPAHVPPAGGDQLDLVLDSRIGLGGSVGPVYVGPSHVLRPAYDAASFSVMVLPRLIDGSLLAIGGIMLLIWLARRHDQLYLLCAGISLSFGVSSLSSVFADSLGEDVLMPVNVARFVGASLVLPFAWRLAGRTPRLRTRWFLLLPLAMYLSFLLLPSGWGSRLVPTVFMPVVLVLAIVATFELARAAVRKRDNGALLMLGAIGAVVVLVARDQLVMLGMLPGGHVLLARFNGPILAMIMGAILLSRFAAGLSMLESFNARLRSDVAAAENKLRAAFERERAHHRKATLEAERMRLMGDLHDGIAGNLVSIISLCEQDAGGGHRSADEIAHASRRALTDLRLVIDSMEDVGADLAMMLTAFRDRVEPQLRRSGIRLDWQARDLPDLPGLAPATTLAIYRILQEAVNNAARHSGSDVVSVKAAASPLAGRGVRLEVRDFGGGGAVVRRGGYGMGNMHKRAQALGALLSVESDAGGTRVLLDLPPSLAAEPAAATSGSGSA